MGPHMLFGLGSSGYGIGEFCDRYRESFHAWWETMGAPTLTHEIARLLADGIAQEEKGRSYVQLVSEGDRKIIAAMKALR